MGSPANSLAIVHKLKDHLREVLKGAEFEFREHRNKEIAWEKEKNELEQELQGLKISSRAEKVDGNSDEWKKATRSELESSVVSLTRERDLMRQKLTNLGFSVDVLLRDGGPEGKSAASPEGGVKRKEEKDEGGVVEETADASAGVGDGKVLVDTSKLDKDTQIMDRLLEENGHLQMRIDSFESELEDAKISVKRAAKVISELSEDVEKERRAKSSLQLENDKLLQDMTSLQKEKEGLEKRLKKTSGIISKHKLNTETEE
jgi:chromosome segregation ATPase|eukprot:g1879.t1